jgi:hypothetical protein
MNYGITAPKFMQDSDKDSTPFAFSLQLNFEW